MTMFAETYKRQLQENIHKLIEELENNVGRPVLYDAAMHWIAKRYPFAEIAIVLEDLQLLMDQGRVIKL